jgi:VCBS repeat-containing protein
LLLDDNVIARHFKWNRTICLFAFGLISCFMILASPSQALAATAAITLSPEDGQVGDSITIQGSGFAPLSEISIEFDGDSVAADPPIMKADEQGEFMAEFAIPPGTPAETIMIEAVDDSANATTASTEFIVINTPPVADEQQPIEIGENGSELISLTASDVNGDTLTLEIVDNPSHGALSEFDEDTGEVVYEPEEGYAGPDSFSFKANDGVEDSGATVISLTVVSAGEPPTVSDFEVGTSEDNQLSITLNATDPDSTSASFVIVSGPTHGTLGEMDETDSFSSQVVYTPDPNYNGQDSFTFKAHDGESYSGIGEVTIAIAGASDSPVATAKSVTVKENSKKKITLEASDADGDALSYSIVSDPDHGNLTGTAPVLHYEPDDGYTGTDSFRFVANDSSSNSNIATITIAVGVEEEDDEDYYYYDEEDYYEDENGYDPANTRPVAYSQSVSGREDTPITIMLTADDMNGDFLTFGIVDYPSFGEISGFDDGTGQLTYTPAAEYSGTDSFTFTAMDDNRESKKETVSISIESVNDPPSPISMNLTAAEGTVSITLGAFDAEGDALQFALYSEPSNGVLSGTAPELAYVADPGFNGYDKFLFTVSDNRPDGRIGVVSILVGEPEPGGGNTTYSESGEGVNAETSDNQEDEDIDSSDSHPDGESDSGMHNNYPEDEKSTTIARADKSKVLVMVSWEHENQDQGVESKLHLEFAEHRTRAPLGTHIWYDLVMLDEGNNEIVRKNDLIALNSEDTQKISFPAEGTYHFEVNVKGLIDKSNNAITRHTDYTGTALGTVVVPELDSAAILIVITAIMGSAIAAMRHRGIADFLGQ